MNRGKNLLSASIILAITKYNLFLCLISKEILFTKYKILSRSILFALFELLSLIKKGIGSFGKKL